MEEEHQVAPASVTFTGRRVSSVRTLTAAWRRRLDVFWGLNRKRRRIGAELQITDKLFSCIVAEQ